MTPESDTPVPWLDRGWMQSVLRDVERDPTLSITHYHVAEDPTSKGEHYMSEMHWITAQVRRGGGGGDGDGTIFLIAKTLPPGKQIQKEVSAASLFPIEIRAFKEVLPRFQAILDGVAGGTSKPFAARHIFSNEDSPCSLIVGDLAPEGFRSVERRRGLDLDHCLLVVRTLGRFHAASVALHGRDPKLVESFKENLFSQDPPSNIPQSFSRSGVFSIARVVRSWPGGETMANKLLGLADTFCRKLRQQILSQGHRLNVLAHGDLWTSNMLFKYNDVTGGVEDVRFVDFQMCCYTSCAIDLQYFMHTSPRDDVRVAHTEDILREYHGELCSTLRLLGLAEKAITFQELMDEYEGKGVYGFLTSLFILPIVLADSESVTDSEGVLAGGDELSDKRSANKEYVKVMKRLLPVFENKGYF